MEEHETRRKIIRQWMALPKDKRHARRMLSVDSLSTIMRDFGVCPGLCGHTQLKELAAQAAALPRDRDGGEPTGTAGATAAAAAGARTPNSPGELSGVLRSVLAYFFL
jgi:hypothetical protein